jgi:hypothetical protein
VTAPQFGREMAAARAQELRRAAERQRFAAAAGRAADAPRPVAARQVRWYLRLVGATLRH